MNMRLACLTMGIAMLCMGLLYVHVPASHAETITRDLQGGVQLEITYPDVLIADREGTVSILVRNSGWEDKQDISFEFLQQSSSAVTVLPPEPVVIEHLAQDGTHGQNLILRASGDAPAGIHFLNIKYSQTLVANNQTPEEPFLLDIAVPITIKAAPNVIVATKTPESVFAGGQFPIELSVLSQDVPITDVRIQIVPPVSIEFLGDTMHTLSRMERGAPTEITSVIVAPPHVETEYKIPFEVVVEYVDDVGEEKQNSQTVSMVLRPRTFMELAGDGGIWIGDLFIAPYVSIGTLVGIPAGAILSLLIRRGGRKRKRHA